MGLKIKPAVDRSEDEREKRERATSEHFPEKKDSGLSTAWKLAPVIGQTADGLATYRNLKSGGEEYNPALRGLAKKSPEALLAGKVALGVGASALANHLYKKYKDRKGGKLLAKTVAGGVAAEGAYGAGYSLAHAGGKGRK